MTTIVTRAGKGSPLTHTEVDTNFTNLNTAKLETAAIPLGTLQAPSVSFLNDSDTGIFCPQGGNSLAIATGAQYAITCTSTQAVGIKTANPQKALHVAGATRVGADDATDAFLEIGEGATGNRNSYIDIVGDTTYTDYGLRFIRNNTGANATSEIKHRGTGNLNFTTQEAGAIVFNTTNSPRVTILPAGNVGIGTSVPGSTLHIEAAGNTVEQRIFTSDNVLNATASLTFGTTPGTRSKAAIRLINSNTGNGSGDLALLTNDGSSLQNRLYITSAGNVGIGTSSPNALLDVRSATAWVGDGTTDAFLQFNQSATAANRWHIGAGSGNAFIFYKGTYGTGVETARIDSSGRLLVGTSIARANFFNTIVSPQFQIEGAGDFDRQAAIISSSSTAAFGGVQILAHQKSGAIGGNTILASGDALGITSFQGSDGTQFVEGARIEAFVDGTPGADDMPGRLVFSTTADGASSPTERVRIPNGGGLSVGSTVNPNALTQASGIRLGSNTIANHDFTNITTSPVNIANGVGIGGLAFVQAYNTANGAQYTGIVMWRSGIVAVVSESNALGFGLTYTVSGSTLYLQTASGTITGSVITLAG